MARDRDVAAFGERAQRYDEDWRGRLHHQIADRTADLALACVPAPAKILDVGCGTGYLLGRLADRVAQARVLAGIDAAPAMIQVATGAATDARLRFVVGTAEQLPWPGQTFDLVVSTTSFDHWADQRAGLAQCARVLAPGGCLVLADLLSAAAPDSGGRAAGQSAHETAGNPAADGSGIARAALAPPRHRHHPGSGRHQIATAQSSRRPKSGRPLLDSS